MRLRPYVHSRDFEKIKNWVTDERAHALWCANRIKFPLESEEFADFIRELFDRTGDCPFTATEDDGNVVGFICCSVNCETNEAMLKFVIVDPSQRGKGYGKEMVRLAAQYAYDIAKVGLVHLNVFTANAAARRCYENAGFTERNTAPDAFEFNGESWGRCNMTIMRDKLPICR